MHDHPDTGDGCVSTPQPHDGASLTAFSLQLCRLWHDDDRRWFHGRSFHSVIRRPVQPADLDYVRREPWEGINIDDKLRRAYPSRILIRRLRSEVWPWEVAFIGGDPETIDAIPLRDWARLMDNQGNPVPAALVAAVMGALAANSLPPWVVDDRDWFAANPGRTIRVRRPFPGELEDLTENAASAQRHGGPRFHDRNIHLFAGPLHPGQMLTPRIVVRQIEPGRRMRRAIEASDDLIASMTEAGWMTALDWGPMASPPPGARTVSA